MLANIWLPLGRSLTDEERHLIEVYERHGSVHKAGKELGIHGQAVHKRLRKIGYDTSVPPEFSEAQLEQIRQYYAETPADDFDLNKLAADLGKGKPNVCRAARRLGFTMQDRLNSVTTNKHLKEARKDQWERKPHPRGMLGKKHTKETKAKFSIFQKRSWITMKTFRIGNMSEESRQKQSDRSSLMMRTRNASQSFSKAACGKRADLGNVFFRSTWEANYARYLNILMRMGVVESWKFEPKTFWFEEIRRGVRSYLPDFCVKYKGDPRLEYVEIKGWITPKDRTKWSRMAKYYPEIKLIVVAKKEYYSIRDKWANAIPNWEFPARKNKVVAA